MGDASLAGGGSVVPSTGAGWPVIEPDAWYGALEAIAGLAGLKVIAPSASITPGWARCSLSAP